MAPSRPPANREDARLGQQLRHKPRARRAKREPDGELALSSSRSHEQEIRKVSTTDRQQHSDGGKERPENRAIVAHDFRVQRDRG